MADRISELPDDAEFAELEEELMPEHDPVPDAGGPFTQCYEFLHGARATLDAELTAPTRLLAATSARSILRLADEHDVELDPDLRARFEAYAAGEVPREQDALIETLADLSGFVERRVQAARAEDG